MSSGIAIGRWLATRRRDLNLTQRELARRIERNQSVVARWESGVLEVTPHDLVALAIGLEFEPTTAFEAASIPVARRRRSSAHWTGAQRGRVAARIAALRRAAQLTPVELSRQTGISPYRLWKIESGSDPSLAELGALVRLFGPGLLPSAEEIEASRPPSPAVAASRG